MGAALSGVGVGLRAGQLKDRKAWGGDVEGLLG